MSAWNIGVSIVAGEDDVRADAVRSVVEGDVAVAPRIARLGGVVDEVPGPGGHALDRRDVDDRSAAVGQHPPNGDGAPVHDADHGAPAARRSMCSLRRLVGGAGDVDAGVVHPVAERAAAPRRRPPRARAPPSRRRRPRPGRTRRPAPPPSRRAATRHGRARPRPRRRSPACAAIALPIPIAAPVTTAEPASAMTTSTIDCGNCTCYPRAYSPPRPATRTRRRRTPRRRPPRRRGRAR